MDGSDASQSGALEGVSGALDGAGGAAGRGLAGGAGGIRSRSLGGGTTVGPGIIIMAEHWRQRTRAPPRGRIDSSIRYRMWHAEHSKVMAGP